MATTSPGMFRRRWWREATKRISRRALRVESASSASTGDSDDDSSITDSPIATPMDVDDDFPEALLPHTDGENIPPCAVSYLPSPDQHVEVPPTVDTITPTVLNTRESSEEAQVPPLIVQPPSLPTLQVQPAAPLQQPTATTRRSARKRTIRDVGDLSICFCVLQYHLDCLEVEEVPDGWICEACTYSEAARGGKRRRTGKK
ncbi:hypothetical protein DFH07DRAFT_783088 [Mycena maculata]|uniref:Zinc finger PHD-type domain-containing protein n=1 Tax=Mycena maculata TaxID=230809 RepID=A0AAD7HP82_9AGAR|nr:hypothetical protein DFH07DRAFT_783088 [Mycena maculata]